MEVGITSSSLLDFILSYIGINQPAIKKFVLSKNAPGLKAFLNLLNISPSIYSSSPFITFP